MPAPFFDVFLPALAGEAGKAGAGALQGMAAAPQYGLDLQAKQFELNKQQQLLPYDLLLKEAHAEYYRNAKQQQKAAMDAYTQLMTGLNTDPNFLTTGKGRALMILASKQDPLALNALAFQREQAGNLSGAKTADVQAQSPEKVKLLGEKQDTEAFRQDSLDALREERQAMAAKLAALTAEIEALRNPKVNLANQKVETEIERANAQRASIGKTEAQTQQTKELTPPKVATEQAKASEHTAKAGQTNALTQPKVATEEARAKELSNRAAQVESLTQPKVETEKSRAGELTSRADVNKAKEADIRALTQPKVGVQKSLETKNLALAGKYGRDTGKPGSTGKMEDFRSKEEFKAGLKEVEKDLKILDTAAALEPDLKRWKELNPTVQTGRLSGHRPGVLQPQYQELLSIENRLAMNNFKPGQGAISNFERSLIKGGGPSTTNDLRTNTNLVNVILGSIGTLRERAEFRQWYLQTHGRLLGADRDWNHYVEKNPRFVSDRHGGIVENPKRADWMTYFQAGAATPSAPASPVPTPAPSGGPQVGEIKKGYRFKGGDPSKQENWEKVP